MPSLATFLCAYAASWASAAVPSLGGAATPIVERVEINYCYHPHDGTLRYKQILYWDYVDSSCLHVVDWHMADPAGPGTDGCERIVCVPGRTYAPYTIIRRGTCGQLSRIARARQLVVTHTFDDPEEDDRAVLPAEGRPGIR